MIVQRQSIVVIVITKSIDKLGYDRRQKGKHRRAGESKGQKVLLCERQDPVAVRV